MRSCIAAALFIKKSHKEMSENNALGRTYHCECQQGLVTACSKSACQYALQHKHFCVDQIQQARVLGPRQYQRVCAIHDSRLFCSSVTLGKVSLDLYGFVQDRAEQHSSHVCTPGTKSVCFIPLLILRYQRTQSFIGEGNTTHTLSQHAFYVITRL